MECVLSRREFATASRDLPLDKHRIQLVEMVPVLSRNLHGSLSVLTRIRQIAGLQRKSRQYAEGVVDVFLRLNSLRKGQGLLKRLCGQVKLALVHVDVADVCEFVRPAPDIPKLQSQVF